VVIGVGKNRMGNKARAVQSILAMTGKSRQVVPEFPIMTLARALRFVLRTSLRVQPLDPTTWRQK
jgi:hypothetical protein